ncbi:nucleotidyltransferase family protein [Thermoproteus uzoniensis]|uniref:nucleotidyltransferase family protein n=1 Tax=Thermoproteus uzoniensis TaxID=184117 RepID=UPI000B1E22E9|nr:nucleotidyltransferase domain-containing protein [Thermoproteus uzoniensis]
MHRYYQLDEASELEAFREIASTMPQIVEAKLPGEPCIDDVGRLREVFERHGVAYAVVFGSVAKRGCGRDLDLAVKFARPVGLWDPAGFAADVAEALDLDYGQVDVVDVDAAPPGLLLSILEGTPVYNGERAREDLARRYVELLDVGEAWRAARRRLGRR